jgi:alpha-tubulin suppressor-like RCC1 family protein
MRRLTLLVLAACQSDVPAVPNAPAPAAPVAPAPLAVPPNAIHAVQIAVAEVHSCARMSDGTLRCWGDNSGGALGDGTDAEERHTPVTVIGVDHAIDIAVGLAFSCARIEGGTVSCWGSTGFLERDEAPPKPHLVAALTGASKLWLSSSGDGCARWPDGNTKCWGMGAGSLAAGSTQSSWPAPALPVLAGATEIAVGESLGCARMKDATVMCWGRNEVGQVGDGTTELRLSPVAVKGLRDVTQIAVAREAACALRTDHTVWCWGSNNAGQLGDGTNTEHHTPVRVPALSDVTSLAAGTVHMCAIRSAGAVTCWGWNSAGQLGDGRSADSSGPVAVAGVDGAIALGLTLHHSCAVRSDGEVLCWGNGMRGDLGNGLQADQPVPAPVKWSFERPPQQGLPAGVGVASFSLDTLHTCASLSDGSVRCWGRNDGGMVIPAAKVDASFATPTPVPGVSRVRRVVVSSWSTEAQLGDGSIVTWGRNQPVHSTTKIAPGAELVESDDFLCQLRTDATLKCINHDGVEASASDVVQVVASMHACVLHKNGTVACAGLNNHGQLGDGTSTDRAAFTTVPGVHGVTQLAVGSFYTCALLADRTVTCWGDIEMTGRGNASTDGPVPIRGLREVVQLAGGGDVACTRKRDNSVACWGHYRHVMTGNRSHWYSATPVDVPWLAGATQFALGMFHSCAMLPSGLACWGKNDAGQLGDGTMDDRDEAVPVRW